MAEPFLAEIKIWGITFAPRGWAMCDGQNLPINQNQSLYALLGTTYGGDGRTSFGLPDLRGRVPIHKGFNGSSGGHLLGEKEGSEKVALTLAQMPSHTHQPQCSQASGTSASPTGNYVAQVTATVGNIYADPGQSSPTTPMNHPIENFGGGHDHENMQPYLTLTFTIALQGLFPSRN